MKRAPLTVLALVVTAPTLTKPPSAENIQLPITRDFDRRCGGSAVVLSPVRFQPPSLKESERRWTN